MLYYALVFLIIAMIAGFLGFGGVEFAAAEIARILFFLFLVLFVHGHLPGSRLFEYTSLQRFFTKIAGGNSPNPKRANAYLNQLTLAGS